MPFGSPSRKALNGLKEWEKPTVINTDKAPTYGIAIAQLKAEGKCPGELVHRQVMCKGQAAIFNLTGDMRGERAHRGYGMLAQNLKSHEAAGVIIFA